MNETEQPATPADDVEGHGAKCFGAPTADAETHDVAGHNFKFGAVPAEYDETDDVEGHNFKI